MDLFKQIVLGSNISREYELLENKINCGYWKLHEGIKKNTKSRVTIFIYEKKASEAISNFVNNQKSTKEGERINELLKKEASQLARLRHPSILHIVEPLEDLRLMLNFCTEPIQLCLSNLLNHDLPLGTNYELDALEIQKGLIQISKGLQFCHENAKLVHGNLIPGSIFVNPKGDWKLSGFGFSKNKEYNTSENAHMEYFEYDTQLPKDCQQNLDYMAPEYILNNQFDFSNDLFALGCLIYSIFNSGKPLLKTRNNILAYKSQVDKLNNIPLDEVPDYFQELVYKLISKHPHNRITIQHFQESPSFNNILVKTIRYFENLVQQPLDNKAQFMQGLNKILNQFPEKVLLRKILPALLEEIKDSRMIPFIIPNLIQIINKINQREFNELVLPNLKPTFLIKGPSQSLACLLTNLEPILQKCNDKNFKEDVMPMIYTCLEGTEASLQEQCLRKIPSFVDKLDYTIIKNSLYLKLQNLYAKTNLLSIKVEVLICFKHILKVLDKDIMLEKLIPLLKNTKSKEPGVKMAIFGLYLEIGDKHLELEDIATVLLPELWKLSINPQFNLSQFQMVMKGIQKLGNKVEQEYKSKLETIHKMEQQQKIEKQQNTIKNTNINITNSSTSFEQLLNQSVNTKPIQKSFSSAPINNQNKDDWGWSDSNINSTQRNSNNKKESEEEVDWQDFFQNENLTKNTNTFESTNLTSSNNINKFNTINSTVNNNFNRSNNSNLNTFNKFTLPPSTTINKLAPPPASNFNNFNRTNNGNSNKSTNFVPINSNVRVPATKSLNLKSNLNIKPIQPTPIKNNNIKNNKKLDQNNWDEFDPLS